MEWSKFQIKFAFFLDVWQCLSFHFTEQGCTTRRKLRQNNNGKPAIKLAVKEMWKGK